MISKTLKRGTVLLDDDSAWIIKIGCLNIRKDGCVLVKEYKGMVNGKTTYKAHYLHRLVMNAPPSMEVDHKDRNRMDNRRQNLRIATRQQNQCNLRKQNLPRATSRFKGVTFLRRLKSKPWCASIGHNNKTIHLGYFETEAAAAMRYNEECLKLRGEYAAPNAI
jgi:hypothetical protein